MIGALLKKNLQFKLSLLLTLCLSFTFSSIALASWQDIQPLKLNITFPAHSDTFALDKIRIAGGTDSGAIVTVDNRWVRVFPHGAFVTRVDLEPGMNQILVRAAKNGRVVTDMLFIYRPPKIETSPVTPTKFDMRVIEPKDDVWLFPGDYLTVKFKGSPEGRASFSLEKVENDIPMTELPPANANGLEGVYTGVVRVNHAPANRPLKVKLELRGMDGKKIQVEAPARVYLLPEEYPIIGMTKNIVYMHGVAKGYAPLSRIRDSVKVQIIGRMGSRFKIRLCPSLTAFIDSKDLKLLPIGTPVPHATVSAPAFTDDSNWYRLSMSVNDQVPYRFASQLDPVSINLYLYGAHQGSHWITFPNYPTEIKDIQMSRVEDGVLKIHVDLDQKQIWGYKLDYKNNHLYFSIRKKPNIADPPASPVKGLIFAVDPGHGGENEGTSSPTGLLEKDINLRWANIFADKLRAAGASVVMTRHDDEDVSLPERIRIATDANAHFFISLHNNSTGPSGNALAARGTSTYYTLPQNQALAWSIYPHLLQLGLQPYGRIQNSYYVTNTTNMLVVLVEGAFLSNPEEEYLLSRDNFLRRLSDAVFSGLEDFLRKQSE